jgi:hypothetical protein
VSSVRCNWWSLREAWCHLGDPWNSPVQPPDSPLVITTWTGSTRLQGRGWSGLYKLGKMVVVHTARFHEGQIHHLQRQFEEPVVSADEQPESRGHCLVLLCKTPSDGASLWSQTQNSLQGHSGPEGVLSTHGAQAQHQVRCRQESRTVLPCKLDASPSNSFPREA